MNKKILFGTLSGIMFGGALWIWEFLHYLNNNYENLKDYETLDIDLCIVSFIGSLIGGLVGTAFGQVVSDCIEQRSEREAYREFFEGQRIETTVNQSVNESTPLLQEHIININNEENLLNTNNSSSHNYCNIL